MTISSKNYHGWVVKSNIGKRGIFLFPDTELGKTFSLSSTLEKVGVEWDRKLKNNTEVVILSDPMEVKRKRYGTLSVVKISANDEEMWALTETIVDIR